MSSGSPPDREFGHAALWAAAIEAAGDLVYRWCRDSDALSWGGAPAPFFALPPARVPLSGRALTALIHPEDRARRNRALAEHGETGAPFDCEYRILTGEGECRWVHERGALCATSEAAARLFGSLRLVTARKQQESHLADLLARDELTGVFSARRLREILGEALEHAARRRQPGAFVAVGVDGLDQINEAFGSATGDAILAEIARRLGHELPGTDTVGRLGGDRFGLVLPGVTEEGAPARGEGLLANVRETPVETLFGPVPVSVSLGIALFPPKPAPATAVITRAEGALGRAKQAGRDSLALHQRTESERRAFRAGLAVARKIRQAIGERRLLLAYQPVVCARSHAVRHYECLVRLRAEDGAIVPAAEFVPVAEQLGMMRAIDRRVLELALCTLNADPEIRLAVNISGLTVSDPAWLAAASDSLRDRPGQASRLIVEITETAAVRNLEDSRHLTARLRELGCKVAIDDFGAGYTCFQHLKDIKADMVKIDGSFVRNVEQRPESQVFVRNLLELARFLGLETVGECVETAAEAAFLTRAGTHLLQGYFFGRPEVTPTPRMSAATVVPLPPRPDTPAATRRKA